MVLRLFSNLFISANLANSIGTTNTTGLRTIHLEYEISCLMDLPRKFANELKLYILFVAKESHGKFLICIENAKIEKIKTCISFKIISEENYVLQNAKCVLQGEIKNFPREKNFFPKSGIDSF